MKAVGKMENTVIGCLAAWLMLNRSRSSPAVVSMQQRAKLIEYLTLFALDDFVILSNRFLFLQSCTGFVLRK